MAFETLSFENPVFHTYMIAAAIMILKLMIQPWITVQRMMKVGGGSAMRLDHPLQRYFRDIHAATNHAFLNADRGAMSMGSE